MDTITVNGLLNQREAARYLGVSERFLEKGRVSGRAPRFVRVGRSIRYDLDDLRNWVDSRKASNTGEADLLDAQGELDRDLR